jgi:regulator of protease activity HflC (stomatin/prohibitin superfamily)
MATRHRDLKPTIPGLAAAAIWLLLAAAWTALLLVSLTGGDAVSWGGVAGALLLGLPLLVALNGFLVVQPNQAKVAVFLGRYMGTVRRSGFHWVNPLTSRRNLSLRIRNLDTDVLKVNDANGNPIEISAVITWQISDAAQAACAPEIAADMLRRQQADAIVAARQRIVEGAVGMVDHALSSLNERDIVELDEERKAAMVSNLMVVLVSDRGAQPVVNSGSLYT